MTEEKIRLSKFMSELGLCSRREADRYIEQGLVFVDGEKVQELGYKVFRTQSVELDEQAQSQQNELATLLINKPIGYVSGQAEKDYEPAVVLVTPENKDPEEKKQWSSKLLRGLAPAGRLDIDSKGLLILTQDGRIAKTLIGENSKIEKEYLVRVQGDITRDRIEKLRHGLSLDGKELKTAVIERLNPDQLRFILNEGRKRQIRRMCELVGLQVVGLKRVRIGQVRLGKLPEGSWRYLGKSEKF